MCEQLGMPIWMTPAHPLVGTPMPVKYQACPEMLEISPHIGSEPTEKQKRIAGSGSTLLLNESHSCRYSF